MLALVAAVEAVVGGLRHDLASPLAEDWRIASLAATEKAPGRDVLCFGDSLVKYGVLPKVIQARAGMSSYNLATSGGTMPSAFFLLRQALEAGARPRAVVADFAALMLGGPRSAGPPELRRAGNRSATASTWHGPRGVADFLDGIGAPSKLLPSYHWRFEIRAWPSGPRSTAGASSNRYGRVDGLPASRAGNGRMGPSRWLRAGSGIPTKTRLIEGVSSGGLGDASRGTEDYLDRFLALAGSHRQIRVLLADASALPRGSCPTGRPWARTWPTTEFVRTDGRGERPRRRGPRRPTVGLRGHGLLRPHPPRPKGCHGPQCRPGVKSSPIAWPGRTGARESSWSEFPAFAGRAVDEPPRALARSRASATLDDPSKGSPNERRDDRSTQRPTSRLLTRTDRHARRWWSAVEAT